MPYPYRERATAVLVKVESPSGVDAAPTGAANAIRMVGTALVESDFMDSGDRDDAQTGVLSGADRSPPAGWFARITIVVEMRGAGAVYSGAVKPPNDALWRAAGFTPSTDFTGGSERYLYTTLDDGMETVTVYAYGAGKLHKMVGCVAAPTLSAEVYKEGRITFVVTGRLTAVTESALPSPLTFTGPVPPRFHSATAAIGSFTTGSAEPLGLVSASVNLGTTVADLSSAGATDGLAGWLITDRNVTQDLTYYAVSLTGFDMFAASKAAGDVAVVTSWQIGNQQYNRVKVSCRWSPRPPREGSRNGVKTYTQSGACKVGGGLTLSREIEILHN